MSISGLSPAVNSYAAAGTPGTAKPASSPAPGAGGKSTQQGNAGGNPSGKPEASTGGDVGAQLAQIIQAMVMLLQGVTSGAAGGNGQPSSSPTSGGKSAPSGGTPAGNTGGSPAGNSPAAGGSSKPSSDGENKPAQSTPYGSEGKSNAQGECPSKSSSGGENKPSSSAPYGGGKPSAAEGQGQQPTGGGEKPQGGGGAKSPTGTKSQAPTGQKGGPITDQELEKATNGNKDIMNGLKKLATDPEGAQVLRRALDNGVTYTVDGSIPKNQDARTQLYPDGSQPPKVILLNNTNAIHTLAHETGHAAKGFEEELGGHSQLAQWAFGIGRKLGDTGI